MNRVLRWVLGGLALFALVMATVVAPRMVVSGMRVPLSRSPSDIGVTRFEEVELTPPDQPIKIRGWWFPADDARAAVVVVHGGGNNRSDPWGGVPELSRDLQQRGFDVLAIDLRNHGTSDSAVDGIVTYGPLEANDVIGAVDYIATRAPKVPVAVIGFSMGGNAVIYAAARDHRIRAVVTVGTYAEGASVVPVAVSAATGLPEIITRAVLWCAERFHGIPLSRARAIDVVPQLDSGSLLLIHNEADPIVPLGHTWFLSNAARDADMWVAPVPPEGDPWYAAQGRWGTHVKEYVLNSAEFVDRVTRHIDARIR